MAPRSSDPVIAVLSQRAVILIGRMRLMGTSQTGYFDNVLI